MRDARRITMENKCEGDNNDNNNNKIKERKNRRIKMGSKVVCHLQYLPRPAIDCLLPVVDF